MEPTEEDCTSDDIGQQGDSVDVDYAEPTSLVYAESVCNPQRGTYIHTYMHT